MTIKSCRYLRLIASTRSPGGRCPSDPLAVSALTLHAQMCRTHRRSRLVSQDETPKTLARLLNVAFDLSLGGSAPREDKLARATLRGIEARPQLAEAEGGSLSSEEASRVLGFSKTAVLQRLDERNTALV